MSTVSQVVREFFDQYERSRNTFDLGLIDAQYPDAFMFAGPSGARVAEKRTVLAGLSKGQELFKTLGHMSTKLTSLSETALDQHYTVVRCAREGYCRRRREATSASDSEMTCGWRPTLSWP